jgi:PhnB protein
MIEPYLFFNGRCEEAAEFYKRAVGAEVTQLMRFKENPDEGAAAYMPPGSAEKIMHMNLKIAGSTVMASDGNCNPTEKFSGFSLSIAVKTEDEARRYFNALGEGGKVQMPLGKTFWSPLFGMVEDRFGVGWMVSVLPEFA